MSGKDLIIVGAGAAGIGAALAAREAGLSAVVLEASKRAGGRAFTDRKSLPVDWDQGASWLHSADINPLTAWADKLGSRYLRQPREDHVLQWHAGRMMSVEESREGGAQTDAAFAAIAAAAARGEDRAMAEVIPDAGKWKNGVRALIQMIEADDPEKVSTLGSADYIDTGHNWPVVTGYGDLIERMARLVDVRYGATVRTVTEDAGGVRVDTDQGSLRAKAALITVSTGVLRSGAIGIAGRSAARTLEGVVDIPMGSYEKVAFALRRPLLEDPKVLFVMTDPGGESDIAVEFVVYNDPAPLLVAHMGGSYARDARKNGLKAMEAFARERLLAVFGMDAEKEIRGSATTDWEQNPLSRGSYSYVRPGGAGARLALLDGQEGPIRFAGEALSRHGQTAVHGAFESGQTQVAQLIADSTVRLNASSAPS